MSNVTPMPTRADWERVETINAELAVKVINLLHERDVLVRALEPFALNVGAVSLGSALGHISREHLLAARDAIIAAGQAKDSL